MGKPILCLDFDGVDWKRVCFSCDKQTTDWEMMTPYYICRGYKPVPICGECALRERDYRKEKGE